jgi:hypothetical protein
VHPGVATLKAADSLESTSLRYGEVGRVPFRSDISLAGAAPGCKQINLSFFITPPGTSPLFSFPQDLLCSKDRKLDFKEALMAHQRLTLHVSIPFFRMLILASFTSCTFFVSPAMAGGEAGYKSGAAGKEVLVFNGKDFSGWTFFLEDPKLKLEDVWSVKPKEGIIVCKGKPNGYIRTVKDYTNFILKFQWRWSPVTKQAGNSGALLRVTGADKIWPRMVEAQLMSGQAGDFWLIDGKRLVTAPERQGDKGEGYDHRKRIKGAEKPVGEWNQYEILCDGDRIALKINGELVNEGTGADVEPGKISLQSEGAEIHFRNIRLTPLGK